MTWTRSGSLRRVMCLYRPYGPDFILKCTLCDRPHSWESVPRTHAVRRHKRASRRESQRPDAAQHTRLPPAQRQINPRMVHIERRQTLYRFHPRSGGVRRHRVTAIYLLSQIRRPRRDVIFLGPKHQRVDIVSRRAVVEHGMMQDLLRQWRRELSISRHPRQTGPRAHRRHSHP